MSSRLPGVDTKLDAALTRGLAKRPEQRFEKAWEFSDALGAAALRADASKIVYEGTRLINAIAAEPVAPAPRSALASVLDRLTFVRPDLRLPIMIGAGGSVLLALAIAIVVILTPIGGPSPSSIATARPALPPGLAAVPRGTAPQRQQGRLEE